MTESLSAASMIKGMTMVRRTVTLDERAVELATRLSGGNFSAYVNEALMRRVRLDGLRELVAEDERRRGPIDSEGIDQVRRELAELDRS